MTASRQRGFSLVELVVSMVVLAVLAGLAVPFVSNGVRAYNDTAATLHTVGKLRYASERIARELREIRSVGGSYSITTPVNASGSSITFFKSDGTRVRIVTASPQVSLAYDSLAADADFVLTDEVTSLTFDYFTENGLSATDTTDVAYIEFELVLNNGAVLRQRSRIALRNQL